MRRHFVGCWDDRSQFTVPKLYKGHVAGYMRHELVDHTIIESSVHMGLGLVDIEPDGYLNPVLHAFEKGFFVLEGSLVAHLNGYDVLLNQGEYGVIPMGTTYAWRNTGKQKARLLEMMSPQPKPEKYFFRDTYFVKDGSAPIDGVAPDHRDPRVSKYLGHFDEAQLPGPTGEIQAVGARGGDIFGISLKELIDRMLGAQHMSLFVVQFQPGGEGTVHDHMFEESYFLTSGEAVATLDGESYHVKAGEYVWTGVGCMHGFKNVGDLPVRWIETQSPLPTPTEAFRFQAQWEYLQRKVEG
jgi:mannose-6-phosphate isomerase-like protein (cupin superfamily)